MRSEIRHKLLKIIKQNKLNTMLIGPTGGGNRDEIYVDEYPSRWYENEIAALAEETDTIIEKGLLK